MKLQNFKSAVQNVTLATAASLTVALPSFAQEASLTEMVTSGLSEGGVKAALLAAGGILIGLAAVGLGIRLVKGIIR